MYQPQINRGEATSDIKQWPELEECLHEMRFLPGWTVHLYTLEGNWGQLCISSPDSNQIFVPIQKADADYPNRVAQLVLKGISDLSRFIFQTNSTIIM